jgi:DNA-binding MarR family transcriptional regulator
MKDRSAETIRGVYNGQYDDRTRQIVKSIRRLIQAGSHYSKQLDRTYHISTPQLNCLLALYENGALPPSQIAHHIMVNSSTVTGIVDRLEKKGLVQRRRSAVDRRVITIELTTAGRQMAQNAPPPVQQQIIDGLRRIPDSEIEQIVHALTTLTRMLDVEDIHWD